MTSFGTVFVQIPCYDPRETIVHGCGAKQKTASEAFGEGVQTPVIESDGAWLMDEIPMIVAEQLR